MERQEAIINSELLVWARETVGLSLVDAANKANINEDRLKEYESGVKRPTVKQLEKFADLYKRPLAAFYLPSPPEPEPEAHFPDFRKGPNVRKLDKSPALLIQIRQARYLRDVALGLVEELEEVIPNLNLSISIKDDPDEVSIKIRNFLNITIDAQKRWKDEYQAYRAWRTALESHSILTFQISKVDVSEIRGFSLALSPLPVVAVNSKDSVLGRIFSLIHEFCHVLLKKDGICDFGNSEKIEVFCNSVAGRTIAPTRELEVEIKNFDGEQVDQFSKSLARKYWVSQHVILRRLHTLNVITDKTYSEYERILSSRAKTKQKNTPVPQHVLRIANLGRLFPSLVFSSYDNQLINSSDVAGYLSLKTAFHDKARQILENKSSEDAVEI